MSTSDDRPPTPSGEPSPPRWDAPPQPPAWDRPASGQPGGVGSGYGTPAGYASPAYGPPPGYGSPYGGYSGPVQTETKAIVALVLAIGSWLVLPLLPAIAALFVARAAARDIDLSMGRLGGHGMVTAARVVSWINIALCVAAVLFLALFFVVVGAASSA